MEIIMPKRKHRIWNTTVAKSFSFARRLPPFVSPPLLFIIPLYISLSHILTFGTTYGREGKYRASILCAMRLNDITMLQFPARQVSAAVAAPWNTILLKCIQQEMHFVNAWQAHTHRHSRIHIETCECDKTLRLASRFAPRKCKWGCCKAEQCSSVSIPKKIARD